jgi:hypothetical protein
VQKSLTVRANLLPVSLFLLLLALRFIGSHPVHWVPITVMAVAGVVIGVLAGRSILRSKDALLGAESEPEVNAILRRTSGLPSALLGSISAIGVFVIAVIYRDPYFWTALTSFFVLANAYVLVRLVAIYRLNSDTNSRNVQPAA